MRHIALDVPAGSPPSTPRIPVSVVRDTERTPRERKPLRRALTAGSRVRHSNSTIARIVKVTPSGGGAKWNVQPAWRRSYTAGPAETHGETPPAPATGAQSCRERLQ